MMLLKKKIKSGAALRKTISQMQSSGKRVVFTNGCFDLLHRGHVEYLERARGLGDCLIVALNSDSSVRKLKGPTRPLNPLSDRAVVIAALASVDYVTWFGGQTPLQIIKLLKPDVLVKGGDWKADTIVGAKEVVSWGGAAKSLSFLKGRSTSGIIARAKSAKRAGDRADLSPAAVCAPLSNHARGRKRK
ncbi:D-glycero-beta-D-manno-heptose 1-phosphate adenylyltransferase [Bdellovibrionota bacterium FG-2]